MSNRTFRFVRRGQLHVGHPAPIRRLIAMGALIPVGYLIYRGLSSLSGTDGGLPALSELGSLMVFSVLVPVVVWMVRNPRLEIAISDGVVQTKWLSGVRSGAIQAFTGSEFDHVLVEEVIPEGASSRLERAYRCSLRRGSDRSQDLFLYQLEDREESQELSEIAAILLKLPIHFHAFSEEVPRLVREAGDQVEIGSSRELPGTESVDQIGRLIREKKWNEIHYKFQSPRWVYPSTLLSTLGGWVIAFIMFRYVAPGESDFGENYFVPMGILLLGGPLHFVWKGYNERAALVIDPDRVAVVHPFFGPEGIERQSIQRVEARGDTSGYMIHFYSSGAHLFSFRGDLTRDEASRLVAGLKRDLQIEDVNMSESGGDGE